VVLADVAGNSVVAALPPALADDPTTSLTNDQDQTTLVAVGIITLFVGIQQQVSVY